MKPLLACSVPVEPASPSKNPLTDAQGYFAACSISFTYAGSSTVTADVDILVARGNFPFRCLYSPWAVVSGVAAVAGRCAEPGERWVIFACLMPPIVERFRICMKPLDEISNPNRCHERYLPGCLAFPLWALRISPSQQWSDAFYNG